MKKGDIISYRKNDQLALSWKDKRVVTMLSTKHKGGTLVPSKYPNQLPVPKPNVILDYTKNMGGVDRTDHYIASYQFLRRTTKWYRKMFFWLLEISIVNSYLLYTMVQKGANKNPIAHKIYRKRLVESLVEERMAFRKQGRPSEGAVFRGPQNERLNGIPHFMDRRDQGSGAFPCVVCRAKNQRKCTIYYCDTCTTKPYLHPDKCFQIYHTKEHF